MLRITVLAIAFFHALSLGHGAVIYVPDTHPTIQDAINSSSGGDTIVVRPGTFVENIDFAGKAITVMSEQGAALTTIDGNQTGSVVTFDNGEANSSVLDGFMVTNGKKKNGGGIYCGSGSPTIKNNMISANTADTDGGGIYCGHGSQVIENNIITYNTASNNGGGLYLLDGSQAITNNTITKNTASNNGGAFYCNTYNLMTIMNSIVWDNTGPEEIFGLPTVTYCCVRGGFSGTGNISADPMFLDPNNNDFHLQQAPPQPGVVNPCVDAGNPVSSMIAGSTRSDGVQDSGVVDMGYHYRRSSVEFYVPDDYPTIQGAIVASANGDTVVVRPGTYVENVDFLGKAITVRSTNGAEATIIDGNRMGSVVTFSNGENKNTILVGFTITNGSGTYFSPYAAYTGGGIYCDGASPRIRNNIIRGNSITSSPSAGGGIFTYKSSPAIVGNKVYDNRSEWGGGFGCHDIDPPSSILIENNIIVDNTADEWGGGIDGVVTALTIANNTIANNTAAGNEGGGAITLEDAMADVHNCIIWNNSLFAGYEIALHSDYSNSIMNISYSDLMNRSSSVYVDTSPSPSQYNEGPGMLDLDPKFSDSSGNDFHLVWNSPCKNTGDNSIGTEQIDFEGDPRIVFGTVDMGADEFYYHLYHVGDVIPGSIIDVKVVGYPTAPVALFLGSGLLDPPFPTQHGILYIGWPPVVRLSIGNIPTTSPQGILSFTVPVPMAWKSGEQYPFQALVGPWGGFSTKFSNLMVLVVE